MLMQDWKLIADSRAVMADSGCMVWRGNCDKDGYGRVEIAGRRHAAHRVALANHLGRALLAGELACHHCDNPPCINPHHLFVGTPGTNAVDRIRKGRGAGVRALEKKDTKTSRSRLPRRPRSMAVGTRALHRAIAENIIRLTGEQHHSVTGLARASGVSAVHLLDFIAGAKGATVDLLDVIASALGVETHELSMTPAIRMHPEAPVTP